MFWFHHTYVLFNLAILVSVTQYLIVVLICISLMTQLKVQAYRGVFGH